MTWLVRIAMVAAGVGIMYLEGQHQPSPGIGFAIAMALIMGAALWGADTIRKDFNQWLDDMGDDYDPY